MIPAIMPGGREGGRDSPEKMEPCFFSVFFLQELRQTSMILISLRSHSKCVPAL